LQIVPQQSALFMPSFGESRRSSMFDDGGHIAQSTMETNCMKMLTLSDLTADLPLDGAIAVCDEFWLDARREGRTPDQRCEIFVSMTASGHAQIPIAGQVSVRLYWSASAVSGSSGIVIAPCDQNPGIYLYGPATLYPHTEGEADAVCRELLASSPLVSRMHAAIHHPLLHEFPDQLRAVL
jgi:hypothetical protein